jgi:uncharacterized protein YbjQ (UPF0145 family)
MKNVITAAGGILLLLASTAVLARDTIVHVPLSSVLEMPEAKTQLDGSVKFYLAGVSHPAVTKQLGSDVSNKKTNGVGKGDEVACRWAALSALLAFQNKAKQSDANAVINLVSYYKRAEFKSATDIECHAGAVVVGVALKGDYAAIRK